VPYGKSTEKVPASLATLSFSSFLLLVFIILIPAKLKGEIEIESTVLPFAIAFPGTCADTSTEKKMKIDNIENNLQ
jgi:hypothetical protein